MEYYSLVNKYRGVVMAGLTREEAVALAELMGKDTYWIWAQK